MRILVVIPCYNEQDAILNVVSRLTEAKANIKSAEVDYLVINDYSSDKTKEILIKHEINHLNLPINLGIGGAVQSGFLFAVDNGYNACIQMDGDGQHPADQINKLIAAYVASGAELVIGSRFIGEESFKSSYLRRIGINYFRHLIILLSGIEIFDNTSGYRLYGRKAMELFAKDYPDEYPEPETILVIAKNNWVIEEVSVQMEARLTGKSSIGGFSSYYYMLKVTLGLLFTFLRKY